MFDFLAETTQLRATRILVVAGLLFALAGVAASTVFSVMKPFGFDDPASESIIAEAELGHATGVEPAPGLVALVPLEGPVRSAAAQAKVDRVASVLRGDRDVARVLTTYTGLGATAISKDGRQTYVLGFYRDGTSDKAKNDAAERIGKRLEPISGVRLGGKGTAYDQVGKQVETDLQRAEMFAFPILFLLSFLIFRSLVAASLPLLIGGLSIVGALALLRVAAEVTGISVFAVNLISGLGLGLAIDYSLFVVSRYREELVRHGPGYEALRATMTTAGRTVLFSSLTVAAAMASMMVFPQRFLFSMGVGGTLVTLLSAVVALTVLPAILALLGDRVNSLAPRSFQQAAERSARIATDGFWYRLSRFVMRRPLTIALAATAAMLVMGLPFLGVKFTGADAGILPTSASARQVDDALKSDFPPGRTEPIVLEARTGPGRLGTNELRVLDERLKNLPGVTAVAPPTQLNVTTARIDVFYRGEIYGDAGQGVVGEIRTLTASMPIKVGGDVAEFVDQKASLSDHLPSAVAIVVVATLIILFLMTGSLILPFKTLLMNLLTVSAAFGVLVFIFQDGRLESVLDYRSQGALDNSMPILLFALAFGLSTDYGVFLLTRIKEARDGGADDTESVAIGLERTGRVVTAAALLFCVAIGALATSKIIFIKENGIGTAAAVAVDATIVRALLVPSLMAMLGRWNWWAPRPLRWLHRRIGINESSAPEPV